MQLIRRQALELGRNFTANACESCKAFFRRVVRLNKQYEFIRSIEDNKFRRQLIEENRAKRREKCEESADSVDSSPVSDGSTIPSPQTHDTNGFLNDLIKNTVNISDEEINNQITEIESSVMSETSSVTEVAAPDPQLVIAPVFPVISNYHSWNQLESIRITELLIASKIIEIHITENVHKIYTFKQLICECQQQMEDNIKDIVSFTKSLNGFKSFCSDDQWTLAKNGCIEMILIRQVLSYNDEGQNFTISGLTAIILYNPNRPNLKHKNYVKLEQQLFCLVCGDKALAINMPIKWQLCDHRKD
ncbi:unnamed protein product [Oppiella nova]|uniref:NR LBD domain-containing protein n=1 Tax=Oppiella nova TaxID=334625 RepID=A0A7R9MA51_9ACAR|nr:unnamed protein product [Oppiella nova]CAG2173428.1 unnamed protein product [Oppiella nova]